MINLIILNGPPGSGKDFAANIICKFDEQQLTIGHDKFAAPLKKAVAAFFCLTPDDVQMYETDRVLKEQPQERFFGKSWREVNIDFAENYAKKNYPRDIFGILLAERLRDKAVENKYYPKNMFVISDCGFIHELIPVINKLGNKNVVLCRMHRDGCSYEFDSRSYITDGMLKEHSLDIKVYDIENNGSVSDLTKQLSHVYHRLAG